MLPIKDCDCEDFPLCEHADNYPEEGPEWCDMCGYHHFGDCMDEDDEDEWN